MRFAVALLTATLATACGGGTKASTPSVATGNLTGPVTATLTAGDVTIETNDGDPTFLFSINGSITDQPADLKVTMPAQNTLSTFAFAALLDLDAVPATGVAITKGGSIQFVTTVDWANSDQSETGTYRAGADSNSTSGTISLKFTSLTKADHTDGVQFYNAHGTVDTSMPGGTSGTTTADTAPIVAHITF